MPCLWRCSDRSSDPWAWAKGSFTFRNEVLSLLKGPLSRDFRDLEIPGVWKTNERPTIVIDSENLGDSRGPFNEKTFAMTPFLSPKSRPSMRNHCCGPALLHLLSVSELRSEQTKSTQLELSQSKHPLSLHSLKYGHVMTRSTFC